MASVERISIPQLVGENWSTWRDKFQALLEYKGLFVAIEQPESVDGKKASGQAKALMILHTQDAFVKLIVGEPTAAKAWEKLKQSFEIDSLEPRKNQRTRCSWNLGAELFKPYNNDLSTIILFP